METAPLLKMSQISKTFPGVLALDKVDFELRRGEVHVLLVNLGSTAVAIEPRDRIAQMVIAPVLHAELVDIGDGELPPTARGAGGFGSTGR